MSKTKRVKLKLSANDINALADKIRDYKDNLDKQVNAFIASLQDIGVKVVNATMGNVSEEDRGRIFGVYFPQPTQSGGNHPAVIQIFGDQVLFLEFSAGKIFGKPPGSFDALPNNPNYGSDYGYGTYPSDKGHWDDPEGWSYQDGDGKWVHTYGVPAYAPMYKADVMMRNLIVHEAKYYFGGNW